METLSRDVTWLRSDAFSKNLQRLDHLKRNGSKFSEATGIDSACDASSVDGGGGLIKDTCLLMEEEDTCLHVF